MTENVTALKEIGELLVDSGAESATLCFQCGLCDSVCPWNLVKDFMVRKLVREAQFGLTAGDEKYGAWQKSQNGDIALHHRRLEITHPTLKTPVLIEAPYPQDSRWWAMVRD